MDVIFAHSDDVVIHLLVNWLSLTDIARLNKACLVSASTRENLYRIFASQRTVFHNLKFSHVYRMRNHHSFLVWLLLRKINIVDLTVTSSLTPHWRLVAEYLKLYGSTLQSLSLPIVKASFLALDDLDGVLFPDLKELTICGRWFSKRLLTSILQSVPKLEQLTLTVRGGIDYADQSAATIGAHCPHLKYLCFGKDFQAQHLLSWLPFCSQLKRLSISTIPDDEARDVLKTIAAHCPALEMLEIMDGKSDCRGDMVGAFTSVLSKCTSLRDIRFNRCGFMSDELLFAFASTKSLIYILDISECDVSNEALAQVAKRCTQLKQISYSTGSSYMATKEASSYFHRGTCVEVESCFDYEEEPYFHSEYEEESDDNYGGGGCGDDYEE